jgi:hypothetical protein
MAIRTRPVGRRKPLLRPNGLLVADRKPIGQESDVDIGVANKERLHRTPILAKKFDRDLRRGLIERFLNFFGGLGQSIGIDIDPDATARTCHVLVRLEPSNGLIKILPAIRALKSDFAGVHVSHKGFLHF